MQLGCSDGSNDEALSINVYENDVCTKRSTVEVESIADTNISFASMQVRLLRREFDTDDPVCHEPSY